jgi:hypothetical protein
MRTDGQTDGWTDMAKLVVAFRHFGKAHKNDVAILILILYTLMT